MRTWFFFEDNGGLSFLERAKNEDMNAFLDAASDQAGPSPTRRKKNPSRHIPAATANAPAEAI